MEDYYEVLELSADCTDLAVKKAFRRLALVWHPDKNPKDGGQRFRRMLEAIEVLGQPDKRRAYDQERAAPEPDRYRVPPSTGPPCPDSAAFANFYNYFGQSMYSGDFMNPPGRGPSMPKARDSSSLPKASRMHNAPPHMQTPMHGGPPPMYNGFFSSMHNKPPPMHSNPPPSMHQTRPSAYTSPPPMHHPPPYSMPPPPSMQNSTHPQMPNNAHRPHDIPFPFDPSFSFENPNFRDYMAQQRAFLEQQAQQRKAKLEKQRQEVQAKKQQEPAGKKQPKPSRRKQKSSDGSHDEGAERKKKRKRRKKHKSSDEETEEEEDPAESTTTEEEEEVDGKRADGPNTNKKWEPQCCICALVASQLQEPLACHPILKIPICTSCLRNYNQEINTELGEDGSETLCTWCADGGELFCCDKCPKAFCVDCIGSLGAAILKKARAKKSWHCFLCAAPPELRYLRDTMKQVEKVKRTKKKSNEGDHNGENVHQRSGRDPQPYQSGSQPPERPVPVPQSKPVPEVHPNEDASHSIPSFDASRWFMHPNVFNDIAKQLRIKPENVKALNALKVLLDGYRELINTTCEKIPELDRVLFVVHFVKQMTGKEDG